MQAAGYGADFNDAADVARTLLVGKSSLSLVVAVCTNSAAVDTVPSDLSLSCLQRGILPPVRLGYCSPAEWRGTLHSTSPQRFRSCWQEKRIRTAHQQLRPLRLRDAHFRVCHANRHLRKRIEYLRGLDVASALVTILRLAQLAASSLATESVSRPAVD